MNKFILLFVVILASCTPLDLLSNGPKVAANVQAGKENTQQIVANQTTTDVGRDYTVKESPIEAQNIERVVVQQTPFWMLVLLVLGWLLPSPNEIARGIKGVLAPLRRSLFKR